jgi:hypothetical protein
MPKNLGVEFADLSPVRVVASMPVDDRHLQPLGFLHGGASATLAESVDTVGAWLNCPPGKMALGSAIMGGLPRGRPRQAVRGLACHPDDTSSPVRSRMMASHRSAGDPGVRNHDELKG